MAPSDRTQQLVDRALQCVDRARRVVNHPEEALDLAHDLRDFAGQFVRWGLEQVPIARDLLPPEPPPEPEPSIWADDATAAPSATEESVPPPPVAAPFSDEDEPRAEDEPRVEEESISRDQLYKVLRVLFDEAVGEGRFLTAREIAEAARKAGLSILPGNVRKILRTRAARHVDTRLRDAETGKVTEFKLGAKGRTWFERNYPVQ